MKWFSQWTLSDTDRGFSRRQFIILDEKVSNASGRHLVLGPVPGRVEVSLSLQVSELNLIRSRRTDNADGKLDLQELVVLMPINLTTNTDAFRHIMNPTSLSSLYVEKKISHRQLGPLRGSSSHFQHFEPTTVKPN